MKNEQGSVAYAMLVVLVLALFVPVILMLDSSTDLNQRKSENEKLATNLAVSGMQSLIYYPGNKADKLLYLKNNPATCNAEIQLPDGGEVDYRQYVVQTTETNVLNPASPISCNDIDLNGDYKIIVTATINDEDNNQMRSSDEPFFFIKQLTYDFTGGIVSVLPSQTGHDAEGSSDITVNVGITTQNLNGKAATVELVNRTDGTSLAPQVIASGTVNSNDYASVSLTIPADIPAGNYSLKVMVEAFVTTIDYTITSPFESITGVLANPSSHTVGTAQIVQVAITTTGLNGTAATVELVTTSGVSLSPQVISPPAAVSNDAAALTLSIPDTLLFGNYNLKVESGTATPVSISYIILERTDFPTITLYVKAGDQQINGAAEPGSSIIVSRNGITIGMDTANGTMNTNGTQGYSVTLYTGVTLSETEEIQVTAQAPGKAISTIAKTTVKAASEPPPPPGYVLIIDPVTNETELAGIENSMTVPDGELVVTASVGSYSTTSGTIAFTASEGITIEDTVSITNDSGGNNAGLSLDSSGGDIIMRNTVFQGTSSNQFNTIDIYAPNGDVDLRGAYIESAREINITAGGNIYAMGATIINSHTGDDITLNVTSATGKIYVEGLSLTTLGIAKAIGTVGFVICGNLASGSPDPLNGMRAFDSGCPPPPSP